MDPVVWFFVLGVVAGLARSDLRVPAAIYDLLSILLLLAIGLKGGVELARHALRRARAVCGRQSVPQLCHARDARNQARRDAG